MFVCPYCGKEGWYPYQSQRWLENYAPNGSCVVQTECCGKGVEISAHMTYSVQKVGTNVKEDDWGRKLKKST